MASLEVIRMGNPNLRKVCETVEIEEIQRPEFQTFLKNLVSTMRVKNGVGIAAPQVDVLKRVFVIEIEDNPRYPNRVNFPIVIANYQNMCSLFELISLNHPNRPHYLRLPQ